MQGRAIVVTTIIREANSCLRAVAQGAAGHGEKFFIVGDVGSPEKFALDCQWYPLSRQAAEFAALANALPTRHYARKNIGYLAAIKSGAVAIHDLDDDNLPLENFWDFSAPLKVQTVAADGWFNIYTLFCDDVVWPRGFPLQFLNSQPPTTTVAGESNAHIVQFLADGDPDVDAVFRLTRPPPPSFKKSPPVELRPDAWCPFNSQNTLFRREVFPLLYLPSHCSFRMTDIWRSLVAQRCLWEVGEGVVFHPATVRQDRNEHDLLKDFALEVDGYLHNDAIRRTLEKCRLDRDLHRSLIVCYEALMAGKFLRGDEMPLVRAWCEALTRLG